MSVILYPATIPLSIASLIPFSTAGINSCGMTPPLIASINSNPGSRWAFFGTFASGSYLGKGLILILTCPYWPLPPVCEAEVENKYIKQTGGNGQYGHVKIKIKPLPKYDPEAKVPKNAHREPGFEFIDAIKGGVIPQEFIPAVEKGIREAMDRGIVAGYKMTDISAELNYGSYHDVDSSEIAYKIAASQAFQEAAKKAKPVILEPIMRVEVKYI